MYERTYNTRVLKPEESTPKKKKRFSWKKVLLIMGILSTIFLIGYSIRHPRFQASEIVVLGTTVIDVEDIKTHVREHLVGTRLWIFPKSSIFLIHEKGLEASLQDSFSRIETVKVKRSTFHTIEVTISEFSAVYVWCSKGVEDCYFMDKQGIVYSTAPVFSGTAYPKIVMDTPAKELPFQAMDIIEVERVSTLEDKLSAINITPNVFRYVSPRQIDIDVLHNKDIATIMIDPNIPTDTTLEYIFSGIRTEPLASLFHNDQKKLLYIDIRFPSKIVYKFDEPAVSVSEE